MKEGAKSIVFPFLASIVMIAATFGLGFKVAQSDFSYLVSYYALFFGCYLAAFYFSNDQHRVLLFLALSILLRFMLIFAFPNLSDDVYRFIWDGSLAVNGINPFNHLPAYFLDHQIQVEGISASLYNELNSPDYYTIYPPVCQGIFAVSRWFFPESWTASAAMMKTFLFAFECGSLWLIWKLLHHFRLPQKRILLYALNPLVIIEIMGNLHFEGAMVFFLLLAIYLLILKKPAWSAISIALSIASKLLPLIFLPFLIRRLGWKKSGFYYAITAISLLLLFSPLLNLVFLENFSASLDLYFRKFEFNASIYYVLRWVGTLVTGYNPIGKIGPLLGLLVMAGIVVKAYKEKEPHYKNLFNVSLFAICMYLFLATTIHPWYTILPLMLCIFTSFRFPILWSGMITLTYINYSYPVYFENLWIVALEYLVVFCYLIWELSLIKKPFGKHIVKK